MSVCVSPETPLANNAGAVILTTQWRSQTAIVAVSTTTTHAQEDRARVRGRLPPPGSIVPLTPVGGKTPACFSLLAVEGDQLYATKVCE